MKASDLAAAFDGSFAAAHASPAATADLLAIRIGGTRYALRLTEVAGLYANLAITKLPSRHPELLGVAFFRASARSDVVPVFDLARLLGEATTATPRWLVLAAAAPIAFAFEHYDAHVRVPAERAGTVIDLGDRTVSLVELASISHTLAARSQKVP